MARTSSSKQSTPAPAPVVAASTPAAAPAPKKAAKESAPKKAAKESAPAPVVAAPAPVESKTETPVEQDSIVNMLNVFGAKLQQLAGQFSTIKSDYKLLEKQLTRRVKNAEKASSRKKKGASNRQPSGFVKPTRISDELAHFLGKASGTEMARTDVSKEINAYIRAHGLQDKTNGRKINADAKLSSLLKVKSEDELTYFNLQRYLKIHFIKNEAAATR